MHLIVIFFLLPFFLFGDESFFLKDNLKKAHAGDFVVIAQGKSYTVFHVLKIQDPFLTIEEITIPSSMASQVVSSWKSWVESGAPLSTSWVHYTLDLDQNTIKNCFSFTKNGWFIVQDGDNFLSSLLSLPFQEVPLEKRKKVGKNEKNIWQPQMVVSGKIIKDVSFNAYRATWPSDGGPLSSKEIEIYLPQDPGKYPAYFPYWLQTQGVISTAKVRIVDSGSELHSPKDTSYKQ